MKVGPPSHRFLLGLNDNLSIVLKPSELSKWKLLIFMLGLTHSSYSHNFDVCWAYLVYLLQAPCSVYLKSVKENVGEF